MKYQLNNRHSIILKQRKGNILGNKTKYYFFDTENKQYISSLFNYGNIKYIEFKGNYYKLHDNTFELITDIKTDMLI